MKNALLILIVLIIAGAIATYVRYGSFDPCDWMEQDLAAGSALPLIVVQGRIKAEFLLQGITDPAPQQCIQAWWKFRRDGAPAAGASSGGRN